MVIGRHEVDFPAVQVDNLGGASQAVQHLIDLGHERIGFVSGPRMSTSSIDRIKGYRNALAQNGHRYDAGLVRQGNLTPQSGFQAAKEVLRRRERPTAILASNDLMAFGVIGIFIGPAVLGVSYTLLSVWVNDPGVEAAEPAQVIERG